MCTSRSRSVTTWSKAGAWFRRREATGRLCQAGTQRCSNGGLAAEFILQGKLGDVKFARSIIYGGRGSIGARGRYDVPSHIDYNLWLGPASMTKLTRPRLHLFTLSVSMIVSSLIH